MKRFLLILCLLGVLSLAGAELFLRYWWGLAEPALYVTHPTIEYMPKPGQEVRVLRRRIAYNDLGMRSPPLDSVDADRLVLAFGDSVLNGQTRSDQDELATVIASREPDWQGHSVLFGNVSARSWGPANIAAWIDEYGVQGADTAIFVLSSHDLLDHPTFAPLNPRTHPTRNRPLALMWLGYKVWNRLFPPPPPPDLQPSVEQARIERGIIELNEMIDRVADAGMRACIVYHLTRSEIAQGPEPAHAVMSNVFARRGLPVVELGPMIAEGAEPGRKVFRDNIHITSYGQTFLARALLECDRQAVVPAS